MLCGYCDLPLTKIPTRVNGKTLYCDRSCAFASIRDIQTPRFESEIEYIKSIREDLDDVFKPSVNLRFLYINGLLKRQTKAQLNLVLDRWVKINQELFSLAEEEDASSSMIYHMGTILTPEFIKRERYMIDVYGV